MRGEVAKETPKKEMDNRRIFMTSTMTLFAFPTYKNVMRVKVG